MNNPLRALAPKIPVRPYLFQTRDGQIIVVMMAWYRPLIGEPRAAVYWRRADDSSLRQELITCLGMWAVETLGITDLRRIRFFAFRRDEIGAVGQFKLIGAHRQRGDLFPVFVPPLTFFLAVRQAFEHLNQEAMKPASETADA